MAHATCAQARLDPHLVKIDFPILDLEVKGKPLVYLDNAATSQKPRYVLDSLDEYWRGANANVHRGVHFLSARATQKFDNSRRIVQRFLNAKEDAEIIFTKGCTEAINLVASSWGRANLKPGDEILLSAMEHHSNIVPWQLIAEATGATIRVIPIKDSGELDLEAYERLLSPKTKLVGCVYVSNSLGTINPIKQMVKMAHEYGAIFLADSAQAGPHLLIDVQDLDVDFLTLSCHKLFAPTGVGVLYGKRQLLEAMPPYHGGGDMIHTVSWEKTTYAEIPNKFEAGTPNVAGVIGLGAAIEYLESLAFRFSGIQEDGQAKTTEAMRLVGDHERALVEAATAELSQIPGVRLIGTAKEKAGIVGFVMDCAHPHDIGTVLDSEGVAIRAGHHCCMPLMTRLGVPATARASFSVYNTPEDVEALVKGVHKVREMFA